MIDNGMRYEIQIPGTIFGRGHPLKHVQISPFESCQFRRPAAEAELNLHTHCFCDSTGQINIESGRLAAFVKEFIRRVVTVTANKQGAAEPQGALRMYHFHYIPLLRRRKRQ